MSSIYIRSPKYGIKEVKFDKEDYELISQYHWCIYHSSGGIFYAQAHIKKNNKNSTIFFHKLITNYKVTDHINHNGLDNRKQNLRKSNSTLNARNSRKTLNKKSSKYKGVSWKKDKNKWASYIRLNRKYIHLGFFEKEKDAALAYNNAALKFFKEHSHLNTC